MSSDLFKKRVGCSPTEYVSVYAKEMLPRVAHVGVAYLLGRKVTSGSLAIRLSFASLCRTTLRFFSPLMAIHRFSSPKAASLHRIHHQKISKQSWNKYCREQINYWHALELLLVYLCGVSLLPVAIAGATQFCVPIYLYWHDPKKDGEFEDYKPLTNGKAEQLLESIKNICNIEQIDTVSDLIRDPPLVMHGLVTACEKNLGCSKEVTGSSLDRRLDYARTRSKTKDKQLIAIADTYALHFFKGRTWLGQLHNWGGASLLACSED